MKRRHARKRRRRNLPLSPLALTRPSRRRRSPPERRATPATAATKQALAHTPKGKAVDADEARIRDLHAKLKITPAQENLWSNVTAVMRDNAKTMEPLRKARYDKAPTMTAVEDFTSYGEITDVHADGIKKFVPVFSALYDSMSDDQKKNADVMFRGGPAQKNKATR